MSNLSRSRLNQPKRQQQASRKPVTLLAAFNAKHSIRHAFAGAAAVAVRADSKNTHDDDDDVKIKEEETDDDDDALLRRVSSMSFDDPLLELHPAHDHNEWIHRMINLNADTTETVSDQDLLDEISKTVKDASTHIVKNRYALVRNVVISTLGAAVVVGVTSRSIPSLHSLHLATGALYTVAKTLKLDKYATGLAGQLMEKQPWLLKARLHKFPVPVWFRKELEKYNLGHAFDWTCGEVFDRLLLEGVRAYTFQTWWGYALSAILPGVIMTGYNQTKEALKVIRGLRMLSSYAGIIRINEIVSSATIPSASSSSSSSSRSASSSQRNGRNQTRWQSAPVDSITDLVNRVDEEIRPKIANVSDDAKSTQVRIKTIELSDDVKSNDINPNPTNRFMTAAALGTTVAVGLCVGQMPTDVITHVFQNEAVQGIAFNGLIQASTFDAYIIKMASHLTDEVLRKIQALKHQIVSSPEKDQNPRLIHHLFGLLLGEQIYSKQMLHALTKDELIQIIRKHHIRIPPTQSLETYSLGQLCAFLQSHQDSVLRITHEQLISSFTRYALEAAVLASITGGLIMIYESVNTPEVATEIGLTKEQVVQFNDPTTDPTIVMDIEQDVKTYLDNNPTVGLVLQEGVHENTPILATDNREYIQSIRAHRRTIRLAIQQERIQQYATKFGLSSSQIEGVTHLGELQALIDTTIRTTTNIQTGVQIDTNRPIQFGTVREDDLIPRHLHEEFKELSFTDLYTTVKRRVASSTVSHIPIVGQMLDTIDTGVSVVNYGKNTYNLGLAFSKLTGVGHIPGITEHLPYAPTQDLENWFSISEAVTDYLAPEKRRNVYDVFMKASINQLKTANFELKAFTKDVVAQVLGTDELTKDLRERFEHNLLTKLYRASTK